MSFSQNSAVPTRAESLGLVSSGRMPLFGVAFFDSNEINSGWCALEGENTATRIKSPTDLRNDALWITNVGADLYFSSALRQIHNTRRVDFLRSSLHQIAVDIGLHTRDVPQLKAGRDTQPAGDVERACLQLAGVVGRTLRTAAKSYGWSEPIDAIRCPSLVEDIAGSIELAPSAAKHFPQLMPSLRSAYQPYSVIPGFHPEHISVTLKYSRLDYARRILMTMVPQDAWRSIPSEHAKAATLESMLDESSPSLVECLVEMDNESVDIANLCAFGVGTTNKKTLRKWVSQPELRWLTRYARVSIQSAWVATGARALPPLAQLPAVLQDDKLLDLSISAGLVAECHVSALMTGAYNSATKQTDFSTWAVWLRATDRALCFSLAAAAQDAGFIVGGYGTGAVTVKVEPSRLDELMAFASEHQLAHPTFHSLIEQHGVANQ